VTRALIVALALPLAGCFLFHGDDDTDVEDDGPVGRDGSVADAAHDARPLRDGEVAGCVPRFDSCRVAWTATAPGVGDGRADPDVAWTANTAAVVYREDEASHLVRFTAEGELFATESLGDLGEARLAAHPDHGALAAGNLGLRWLDAEGRPLGDPLAYRPQGREAAGVDVAATPAGYLLFAVPGRSSDGPPIAARLGPEPGEPVFEEFATGDPLIPYEHAEDAAGFGTYVGVEIGVETGLFPTAVRLGDGPGTIVGSGAPRSATTFLDGMVAVGSGGAERIFFYYQSFFPTLVEVGGTGEIFELDPIMGTGNNGHVSALGDEVVVFVTDPSGAVQGVGWRPGSEPGTPLQLAAPDDRRTREIRSAPWPRGLLAAWECTDGVCAAAIECCTP